MNDDAIKEIDEALQKAKAARANVVPPAVPRDTAVERSAAWNNAVRPAFIEMRDLLAARDVKVEIAPLGESTSGTFVIPEKPSDKWWTPSVIVDADHTGLTIKLTYGLGDGPGNKVYKLAYNEVTQEKIAALVHEMVLGALRAEAKP